MNQAILFSDNEQYNAALQQIAFQAQCQGALITCLISVERLYELNEQPVPVEDQSEMFSELAVLALFDAARFDIEDLAEELIKQQSFQQDGHIQL